MPRTRPASARRAAPGIAAVATACAAVTAVACAVLTGTPAAAVNSAGRPAPAVHSAAVHSAAARPAAARPAADSPSPSESPCPGGGSQPCPADSKDRDQVDAGTAKVEQEEDQAKADIGAAKDQEAKCPPTSKQCMTDLAGDGKAEKDGMAKAQQQLDAEHPAPTDNAEAAVDGACADFHAQLPPGLSPADDPDEATRVCELMNR